MFFQRFSIVVLTDEERPFHKSLVSCTDVIVNRLDPSTHADTEHGYGVLFPLPADDRTEYQLYGNHMSKEKLRNDVLGVYELYELFVIQGHQDRFDIKVRHISCNCKLSA